MTNTCPVCPRISTAKLADTLVQAKKGSHRAAVRRHPVAIAYRGAVPQARSAGHAPVLLPGHRVLHGAACMAKPSFPTPNHAQRSVPDGTPAT